MSESPRVASLAFAIEHEGVDNVWWAIDEDGVVAVFVCAGTAMVPRGFDPIDAERVSAALAALPIVDAPGEFAGIRDVGDPVARGCFYFDAGGQHSDAYACWARPTTPLRLTPDDDRLPRAGLFPLVGSFARFAVGDVIARWTRVVGGGPGETPIIVRAP